MGGIAPSLRRLPLARHPLRLGDLIWRHVSERSVSRCTAATPGRARASPVANGSALVLFVLVCVRWRRPWRKHANSRLFCARTWSATPACQRGRGSHPGAARALRSDLIDPTIAVHHGRVVKRTGDGSIVEFRSVVDAVRCAIEVQNAMVERNAGVPEDRRIVFRIGIHLGDVVEESDGDLMGDASTSRRDWKASRNRARSAFPRMPIAR